MEQAITKETEDSLSRSETVEFSTSWRQPFSVFRSNARQKRRVIIICVIVLYFLFFKVITSRFSTLGDETNGGKGDGDVGDNHVDAIIIHYEKRALREYVLEDELAGDLAPLDSTTSANALQSYMALKESKSGPVHEIGQKIFLTIQLYDGYGIRKKNGGDNLRIRMHESELGAISAGYVIDHNNGTYTGVVTAMWAGTPTISVSLFYTREAIHAIYSTRRRIRSTRVIMALFETGTGKEATECHPFPFAQDEELCDLTSLNKGMSWFCKKPANPLISCSDWTMVKPRSPLPTLPISEVERRLLSNDAIGVELPEKITVRVVPNDNEQDHRMASRRCSDIDKTHLWDQQYPTGYFFQNKWNIRQCHGPRGLNEKLNCIRCHDIRLIGDAMLRSWFLQFVSELHCQPSNLDWHDEPWYVPTKCKNFDFNFKVSWQTHAMPMNIGENWERRRYASESIASQIDQIDSDSKLVVVVHLYAHTLVYGHGVFMNRMRAIRQSIERLFDRKSDATVVIKGPHTFRMTPLGGAERQPDYFSYLYRDIIIEEFQEIRNKVLFLDEIDMSIARNLQFNYADKQYAADTLERFLAYTCDF